MVLNDVHSQLNETHVAKVFYPKSTEDIVKSVKQARRQGKAISISGGRHAMGGQQFGEGTYHISMREMHDVMAFDRERGIVKVEAGIEWPKLVEYLIREQDGEWPQWGIVQKQTGADRLSLGGALSANAHGRGVVYQPLIQDVDSFTLVNAKGDVISVSREENHELFGLVIGGYGLFGVIATVDLRLQPRQKLKRVVELITIDELPDEARQRLEDGYLYGDFQYKTDTTAEDFMQVGVLSAYKPVDRDTPVPKGQKRLSSDQWYELIHLAHTDKSKAFEIYSQHYLGTNGQIYWSDSHQMSFYSEGYIEYLEKKIPDYPKGSLMITEVYVPRDRLKDLITVLINDIRSMKMNVVYGTMRLIKMDQESFLSWAKQDYACIIFNLRVEHSPPGIENAQKNFRRIIDRALEFDGSYFLTYHRWARKDQLLKAYPQFPEFLRRKLAYDPEERFQSEWYRHYRKMFAEEFDHHEHTSLED